MTVQPQTKTCGGPSGRIAGDVAADESLPLSGDQGCETFTGALESPSGAQNRQESNRLTVWT